MSSLERILNMSPERKQMGFNVVRALYRIRNHPKVGAEANRLRERIETEATDDEIRAQFKELCLKCRAL